MNACSSLSRTSKARTISASTSTIPLYHPKMSLPLPFELVDVIIECLSGDSWTLESCALVARAWTGPSQRALFHHIDLAHALMPDGLLLHLAHHPHLTPLIRYITLSEFPPGSEEIDALEYANSVVALLRSLPQLTSLTVSYLPVWRDPGHFPLVFADLIPKLSLTAITIKGFYTQYNFQQALSSLDGSQIRRVSLIALGVQPPIPGFTPNVVRLPFVEFLFLVLGTHRYDVLQVWFGKPHITFPRLKHCELTTRTPAEMTVWLDWFRQSTLRLDFLRVKLIRTAVHPPTNALSALDGLHCKHLELCLTWNATYAEPSSVIEWWSAAFQSLADSGPTIHFTTLTLALPPHYRGWDTLVGVLSHDAFSAVQKIYH